jgi:hypothetical protein
MPLNKENVTLGTWVMMPTYLIFAAGVGAGTLLTPVSRLLQTPTLAYANSYVPIHAWGVVFLVVAGSLAVSRLLEHRTAYMATLSIMLLWIGFYALMCVFAADNGQAAWSSWLWPTFVARACWATLLSLAAREK